jgi:hypothetical protein
MKRNLGSSVTNPCRMRSMGISKLTMRSIVLKRQDSYSGPNGTKLYTKLNRNSNKNSKYARNNSGILDRIFTVKMSAN